MFSISILIPTYNSEKTIRACLESIYMQDYPKGLIEIIIADPGSVDNTRKIVNEMKIRNRDINLSIVPNFLKTGEAGKASALKYAKGDIIALIDSDNILPEKDWLRNMTAPFNDNEIVGSEPIEYTYRKEDGFITRYCAMIGMNDPICMFMGNYDRYNLLTDRWTEMPVIVKDRGDYLKVSLDEKHLPTIGANGFLIRRDALIKCSVENYLFDIDIIWEILTNGYTYQNISCNNIAKVKTGIVHIFSGSISDFSRKQMRRIKDFFYFKQLDVRKYPWGELDKLRLCRFVVYSILIIPLFIQMIKGFFKRPDSAWLFHPAACVITLWIYVYGTITGKLFPSPLDRRGWKQ